MKAHIIPIAGEPLRAYVRSRSRPAEIWHLTDLEEYDLNGFCSCETFAFRMQPALERGERGEHLQCWHIRAARRYVLDTLLAQIAAARRRAGRAA
jgi:hypothetical protein